MAKVGWLLLAVLSKVTQCLPVVLPSLEGSHVLPTSGACMNSPKGRGKFFSNFLKLSPRAAFNLENWVIIKFTGSLIYPCTRSYQ